MNAGSPLVLLVEDHAVMGKMLARFLHERGQMEIWALVQTAEAALEKLAATANGGVPQVALIDVSLPGMSGIDLVAELTQLYPRLPCLMVSAHRDPGYARQALANGARGYVTKGDPPAIIAAVRAVLAGERYLSEDLQQALDG